MQLHYQRQQQMAVLGTLIGSTLVSFAAFSGALKAKAYPLNPCPGIYYEEPFNSTRIVPQGCPPNAATQQLNQTSNQTGGQGVRLQPDTGTSRAWTYESNQPQSSNPASQGNAIASVALANGLFDVSVSNNTNALVSYEVIGHTQRRYLQGGESVQLQGLPAPATITFVRQDNGFVEVVPVSTAQSGLLTISLIEDVNPSDSTAGALRIQNDGQVYLN